jgi:plastocyanin
MKSTRFLAVLAVMAMMFGVVACGGGGLDVEAADVTFDIEAIEIKGATDGIEAPSVDPTSLSAGYRYKAPGDYDADNPAKWQVSTYMFSPGAMSVVKGDDVTLRLFGVNGDEHVIWVEAPDGSKSVANVTLNRGREISLNFTADQVGHYKLICATHGPTMTADILSVG